MNEAARFPTPTSSGRVLDVSHPEQQDAWRAVVCDGVRHLLVARCGPRLRAIILTGSLARGEATALRHPDGWKLASDADFLLVFRQLAQIPPAGELEQAGAEVTALLARRGFRCAVALGAVGPAYLRRLPPSIFAYELRTCGHVAWGDPRILEEIPPFAAARIPREDAWRLLSNRLVEVLEVIREAFGAESPLSDEGRYRAVKLYLDSATSLSVFATAYEPSYRARAQALRALAEREPDSAWPIPIRHFAADVSGCTDWKVNPLAPDMGADGALLRRAIGYARPLWRWELAQMTGLPQHLGESVLLETWARRQPLAQRLRGWLHVARRMRGLRSRSHWHWARWSLEARRTSPRHAVYGATAALMSALAAPVDPGEPRPVAGSVRHLIRRTLPVPDIPSVNGAPASWQTLSAAVLWNYHSFIVDTRA